MLARWTGECAKAWLPALGKACEPVKMLAKGEPGAVCAALCLAGLMETALFAGLVVTPKPGQFSRWNCSVAAAVLLPDSPDTSGLRE